MTKQKKLHMTIQTNKKPNVCSTPMQLKQRYVNITITLNTFLLYNHSMPPEI